MDHPSILGEGPEGPKIDQMLALAGTDLCHVGDSREAFVRPMVDRALQQVDASGLFHTPTRFSVATLVLSGILAACNPHSCSKSASGADCFFLSQGEVTRRTVAATTSTPRAGTSARCTTTYQSAKTLPGRATRSGSPGCETHSEQLLLAVTSSSHRTTSRSCVRLLPRCVMASLSVRESLTRTQRRRL